MTVVEEENDFTEAVDVINALQEKKMSEKERIVKEIEALKQDVIKFRADFEENGPMAPDIDAAETLRRLKHFKGEFSIYVRKFLSYDIEETRLDLPH